MLRGGVKQTIGTTAIIRLRTTDDPRGQSSPRRLASPAGFEPATSSLEGCCSIHLSYGPASEGIVPFACLIKGSGQSLRLSQEINASTVPDART